MIIGSLDTAKRVIVVAEIGNNHEGDFGLAKELIDQASDTGADAVKFQTFVPEHYVSRDQAERLARLRKFAFAIDQFRELANYAHAKKLEFFSTPFDLQSAVALAQFCPAIKISSGDNVFYPLLKTVAQSQKPIILSTGLANLSDVEVAVRTLQGEWHTTRHTGSLGLLHCVSSYPTPPEHANLSAISALRQKFPSATIGYSDHTLGSEASVLSVALGARIVEKHFTIRKDYSDFRDHQLSADPPEMAELVHRIRLAETYLGDGVSETSQIEEGNRNAMRRSIAAARPLVRGTIVRLEDLAWVRPAGGFPPGSEKRVVGRRIAHDVATGQIISESDVE
jgi:N,N'-diacetyllegionaminate synthase